MSTNTRTTGRLSAKVAGSIAVVGAAAAVAGLGTFGGFTGSTSALDASAGTGVLSVDVSQAGSSAPVPIATVSMLPGDVGAFPMDLHNSGTVDLSTVKLDSRAVTSSLLDTDRQHGLQLKLETCEAAWVRTSATSFTCATGKKELYAGPVAADVTLDGAYSLTAGKKDHLLATVSFPTTGGDALQGQSSSMEFVFVATQRDGAAR